MATPKVKATYSLDSETVRKLEDMAQRWGVSKSEAVRRAIRSAAGTAAEPVRPALRALDALQRSVALDPARARRWAGRTRSKRSASSSRREHG